MAQDPLNELRTAISERLGTLWRPEPDEPEIEYDSPAPDAEAGAEPPVLPAPEHADSPRYGIAAPAPANALREEVADEIASMLRAKRYSMDPLNLSTPLPLGARLKPRGVFEDDWSARPDAEHPWPIILLHGTTDAKGVWQQLGQELREDGWAVFAPDYGMRATGPLADAARQVADYIAAVRTVTGADKVILVGHSQGGLVARYVLRTEQLAGSIHVRHVVCISSPNHGTAQGGIVSPLVATRRQEYVMKSVIDSYFGPAGMEQIVGSDALAFVNGDGDLVDGVTYTCIATKQDTVVVPPATCFLDPSDSPDGTVRNVYIQDFDRLALTAHQDMPMDKRVRAIVRAVVKQLAEAARDAAPS